MTVIDRIMAKVELLDNEAGYPWCWQWTGEKSSGGYGRIRIAGKKRSVHRATYSYFFGEVPAGLDLDHFICENRACVNPLHVRPVTRRENVLRSNSLQALNAAKTECLRGHSLEDPENLKPGGMKRGKRTCRICYNARYRQRYHAKKQVA